MPILKICTVLLSAISAAGVAYFVSARLNSLIRTFFIYHCPGVIKKFLQRRKIGKIEEQLVAAIDMLSNCLSAGLSLQQAFQMISEEAPRPISEEFRSVVNQIKMGKGLKDALAELKKSVPLEDVCILVESIFVLCETGGNLVETFKSVALTIRERQKIMGKIKVLTAQGILQAIIILSLPFVLGAGLYIVADWYIVPLFTNSIGWLLLFVAIVLQLIGALWLKKIVTIKV